MRGEVGDVFADVDDVFVVDEVGVGGVEGGGDLVEEEDAGEEAEGVGVGY